MLKPSIFNKNLANDMFDEMLSPMVGYRNVNTMHSDIKETENEYVVSIDLPGFAKEDIKADIKDGYINISATRKSDKSEKDEEGKYIYRERFIGTCQRSFYVGDGVTENDIKAEFKEGVLTVTVPKKELLPEETKKKKILIQG